MAPTGSIYVHCDWRTAHYQKVLLDEVFGYENFKNEIIWQSAIGDTSAKNKKFIKSHETILVYTQGQSWTWNDVFQSYGEQAEKIYKYKDDKGKYQLGPCDNPGGGGYKYDLGFGEKMPSRGYSMPKSTALEWLHQNSLVVEEGKVPLRKWYMNEEGVRCRDVWGDIGKERGYVYPTQKPVHLLQRIITASSNPGDIILDCFCGSGTTAVAAETMKDSDGKPAPRRWIAIDNGKFAIHLTRKRLIEANARPFAVENVGFYARNEPWQDKYAKSPSASLYRAAMVAVYGGEPVEGYAYLHGKKRSRWIHVGPLNAPVVESQLLCIVEEAAASDIHSVDVLSADIGIDFNQSLIEPYGVSVQIKIIPQAALDAVRERLRRKRAKDPLTESAPDIHFFTPPDIEVRAEVNRDSVTVRLTRLTVDLDDCLSTQDAAKRAEIKARITDWKALVDYWAVDWDYDGQTFRNDWQTFRTRKSREIAPQAAHTYGDVRGERTIAVKVTDIFGNDGLKVIRVTL